jgi:hypothetical protein
MGEEVAAVDVEGRRPPPLRVSHGMDSVNAERSTSPTLTALVAADLDRVSGPPEVRVVVDSSVSPDRRPHLVLVGEPSTDGGQTKRMDVGPEKRSWTSADALGRRTPNTSPSSTTMTP